MSYLNDTPRFTRKHTIAQTRDYLRYLGSPEKSFRVIHVAGTNGKGSVCAALAQILQCAGFHVGLFTSPHLVTTRERMVIDSEMISEEAFLEDFREVRAMLRFRRDFAHPTYFEYLFLMALVRFRKAHVDAAVLETGLGGRLDATTAVEAPDVTVITSIGMDHMQYLGDTIARVAAEKAGIIRPGVPVIYDAGDPAAAEVIARRASELGALAYPVDMGRCAQIRQTAEGIRFTYESSCGALPLKIPYQAPYQVMNAALAAEAACQFLRRAQIRRQEADPAADSTVCSAAITAAITEGIRRSALPGRMEITRDGIVLDGAHNPAAMEAFLRSVRGLAGPGQILLFGCMQDKDYRQMAEQIVRSGLFDAIVVTGLDTPRAVDPRTLAAHLTDTGEIRVRIAADPACALETARQLRGDRKYLFAAGSLYLTGRLEELL